MIENMKLNLTVYGEAMRSLTDEQRQAISDHELITATAMYEACQKREPIIEFKTQDELNSSLKEWQERLFLMDWIIVANFSDGCTINGEELSGKSNFQIDGKCAVIQIATKTEDNSNRIVKYCDELTLVHELLHCKYNWIHDSEYGLEDVYYDTLEHAQLEQMAKSLIMAKYNIPFDWFKNF